MGSRMSNNLILGLDPSLTSTGWCVMAEADERIISKGRITSNNKYEEDVRVMTICQDICMIAQEYLVSEVAMEGQFSAGLNLSTGLLLSRLRGAVMHAIRTEGLNIFYYQPSDVKKVITGKGNAGKEIVFESLSDIYKEDAVFLDIGPYSDKPGKKKTSDIYDAVGVCYTHIKRKRNG